MKRILFCVVFLLFVSTKVFAADYYFAGVNAFKKSFYNEAISNLEHAIKINPKNVNARYYLAQSYLMQKRTFDAINQYSRIILLAPNSDAAILSQKGIYLIKQSEQGVGAKTALEITNENLGKYQDNYLDYVLTGDGKILKWASFPITVHIESKKQKDLAQQAFKQWQEKSKNLVSFNFINTPDAQIVLDFKDELESSSNQDSYIAGYSKPYYQGNHITKSEIHILTINPETKKDLDDEFIIFSTLHEIGHSLGFKGHSPDEKDIMAPSASSPKLSLTQRDLNTLNVFYKINEKTLLAKNNGQTDVRLQQALDYVKKTPDKAVGWANLGDIYRGKKMYSEAIKNYQKAVSIEPSKAELYNLLGSVYAQTGDKNNAFNNLKKACDLEKTNSFYLYEFAKVCLKSGRKDIGKSYINSYLKVNPKSASDEKIKSLLNSYK